MQKIAFIHILQFAFTISGRHPESKLSTPRTPQRKPSCSLEERRPSSVPAENKPDFLLTCQVFPGRAPCQWAGNGLLWLSHFADLMLSFPGSLPSNVLSEKLFSCIWMWYPTTDDNPWQELQEEFAWEISSVKFLLQLVLPLRISIPSCSFQGWSFVKLRARRGFPVFIWVWTIWILLEAQVAISCFWTLVFLCSCCLVVI